MSLSTSFKGDTRNFYWELYRVPLISMIVLSNDDVLFSDRLSNYAWARTFPNWVRVRSCYNALSCLDISYILEKSFARYADINYSESFKGNTFCPPKRPARIFYRSMFYENIHHIFTNLSLWWFLLNILFFFYIYPYVLTERFIYLYKMQYYKCNLKNELYRKINN